MHTVRCISPSAIQDLQSIQSQWSTITVGISPLLPRRIWVLRDSLIHIDNLYRTKQLIRFLWKYKLKTSFDKRPSIDSLIQSSPYIFSPYSVNKFIDFSNNLYRTGLGWTWKTQTVWLWTSGSQQPSRFIMTVNLFGHSTLVELDHQSQQRSVDQKNLKPRNFHSG